MTVNGHQHVVGQLRDKARSMQNANADPKLATQVEALVNRYNTLGENTAVRFLKYLSYVFLGFYFEMS